MRIAVLCLPGIGDALMATPMIRLLKKAYPHATIDVICMFASVAYVFKNNPYVQNIYDVPLYKKSNIPGFRLGHYNFQALSQLFHVRQKKYDVSILTFPSFGKEYHLVSWLIGAKKRIAHAFGKGYSSELHFLETDTVPVDENVHNVINNVNLLKALGVEIPVKSNKKWTYDLSLFKNDILFGKSFIKRLGWNKKDLIAIHPGSIDSKAGLLKRWSVKRYTKLIDSLTKQGKKVLLFVGPFEILLGKEIEKLVQGENCLLIEDTTFGQSLGILSHCRLLVSNDNGFSHIANALQIPEVVLFGPTNPTWCAPYNNTKTIVIRKASFTPWFRNDTKVTNPPTGAKSGMEEISVHDVLQKVNILL